MRTSFTISLKRSTLIFRYPQAVACTGPASFDRLRLRYRQDEPPGPVAAQGRDQRTAGANACHKACATVGANHINPQPLEQLPIIWSDGHYSHPQPSPFAFSAAIPILEADCPQEEAKRLLARFNRFQSLRSLQA